MKFALIALVVLTGALNTVQTGCNATLRKELDRPFVSLMIIFAVGFSAALVAWLVSGEKLPASANFAQLPWWAWVGGTCGALYILSMLLAADKLGAAVFMGVTVTFAILSSLVLDHFGWMGFEVHKAGVGRIVGGLLMLGGLGLIARY